MTTSTAATPSILHRWSESISAVLPTGEGITEDQFQARQRLMRWVIALHVPFLLAVGIATYDGSESVGHDLAHVVPFIPFVALAFSNRYSRLTLSVSVALAINGFSGLLIHFTDGLIESHFHFFVVLPLISLYVDWRPLMTSIGYVLVHHAVFGLLEPTSMYNHAAAQADPVKWAIIHAAYVTALTAVLIIQWNILEKQRRRLADTIDELRQTQASLVQAQKLEAIGSLASGIAHEINTPIQYVSDNVRFLNDGFIDLLQVIDGQREALSTPIDNPDYTAAVARAARLADEADLEFLLDEVPGAIAQSLSGVDRVTEIVRAMKGFAHAGGDDFAPTDLNVAIADTAVVARNEWKYVSTLSTDLAENLPTVKVQAGPLKQVLLNLIVNAAHAIQDRFGADEVKGQIHISTTREDRAVLISVRDNGGGIPDDVADRIYDQFFTTKDVGRGSGQGLSISRSVIVDQHGGELWFESSAGEGTTFFVRLPLDRERPSIEHAA